jgi:hypothetical protein
VATHFPAEQESVVQTLLSLQIIGVWEQVLVQTQGPEATSVVQAFASSQFKIAGILVKVTVESSVAVRATTVPVPTCK